MVIRSVAVFGLLWMVLLAGCAAPADEGEVVRVASIVPVSEAQYEFKLAGDARLTGDDRTLQLVVKHNNRLVDAFNYNARASDDHKVLKTYLVPAGEVRVEVVEDRNVILAAQLNPEECPNGRADAVVQVEDRRYMYDGSVQIDYGCTV